MIRWPLLSCSVLGLDVRHKMVILNNILPPLSVLKSVTTTHSLLARLHAGPLALVHRLLQPGQIPRSHWLCPKLYRVFWRCPLVLLLSQQHFIYLTLWLLWLVDKLERPITAGYLACREVSVPVTRARVSFKSSHAKRCLVLRPFQSGDFGVRVGVR